MAIENKKGGWTSYQTFNATMLAIMALSIGSMAFRNIDFTPDPSEFSFTGDVAFTTEDEITALKHCFTHLSTGISGSIDLEGAEAIIRAHSEDGEGMAISAEMLSGMADMKADFGSSIAGFHIYYTQRDSRKGVVIIPVNSRNEELLIEEEGAAPYRYMEITADFYAPCPDLCDYYELPR